MNQAINLNLRSKKTCIFFKVLACGSLLHLNRISKLTIVHIWKISITFSIYNYWQSVFSVKLFHLLFFYPVQGSEPLKTTLEVVTGHSHITVALKAYFNLMKPYFTMDYKKDELKLKNDLYRPKPRARSTKASNAVISNQQSKDAVYNELNAPKPSERLDFLLLLK